ncbi:hypothetical protein HanIR_Chr16g0798231 [Helianthus annuus]|nr:hypothetical protein HanIR_Chr16g0798231 [Helianthus annuus]
MLVAMVVGLVVVVAPGLFKVCLCVCDNEKKGSYLYFLNFKCYFLLFILWIVK